MSIPDFGPFDPRAVIELYGSATKVNFPALAWFDFRDRPMAVWGGEFDFEAGGTIWKGLGAAASLIKIDGLEETAALEASTMTITLSGVEAALMAVAAGEDRADYVGRMLVIYGLFCGTSPDDLWKPVGSPLALRAGIMGPMSISRTEQAGGWLRTITLPADNIFSGRGVPPLSFYTDADQQLRHPGQGDTGLSQVSGLQDLPIPVPWH